MTVWFGVDEMTLVQRPTRAIEVQPAVSTQVVAGRPIGEYRRTTPPHADVYVTTPHRVVHTEPAEFFVVSSREVRAVGVSKRKGVATQRRMKSVSVLA